MLIAPRRDAQAQILCDCPCDPCECFLQAGDTGLAVRGIILLLTDQGYLDTGHRVDSFDGEAEAAARAFQADCGLAATGTMDDDTLTFLI